MSPRGGRLINDRSRQMIRFREHLPKRGAKAKDDRLFPEDRPSRRLAAADAIAAVPRVRNDSDLSVKLAGSGGQEPLFVIIHRQDAFAAVPQSQGEVQAFAFSASPVVFPLTVIRRRQCLALCLQIDMASAQAHVVLVGRPAAILLPFIVPTADRQARISLADDPGAKARNESSSAYTA